MRQALITDLCQYGIAGYNQIEIELPPYIFNKKHCENNRKITLILTYHININSNDPNNLIQVLQNCTFGNLHQSQPLYYDLCLINYKIYFDNNLPNSFRHQLLSHSKYIYLRDCCHNEILATIPKQFEIKSLQNFWFQIYHTEQNKVNKKIYQARLNYQSKASMQAANKAKILIIGSGVSGACMYHVLRKSGLFKVFISESSNPQSQFKGLDAVTLKPNFNSNFDAKSRFYFYAYKIVHNNFNKQFNKKIKSNVTSILELINLNYRYNKNYSNNAIKTSMQEKMQRFIPSELRHLNNFAKVIKLGKQYALNFMQGIMLQPLSLINYLLDKQKNCFFNNQISKLIKLTNGKFKVICSNQELASIEFDYLVFASGASLSSIPIQIANKDFNINFSFNASSGVCGSYNGKDINWKTDFQQLHGIKYGIKHNFFSKNLITIGSSFSKVVATPSPRNIMYTQAKNLSYFLHQFSEFANTKHQRQENIKPINCYQGNRAMTRDYLPLVGSLLHSKLWHAFSYKQKNRSKNINLLQIYTKPELQDLKNIFIIQGQGSRGFVSALLCAKIVQAEILGLSLPICSKVYKQIMATRFVIKPYMKF